VSRIRSCVALVRPQTADSIPGALSVVEKVVRLSDGRRLFLLRLDVVNVGPGWYGHDSRFIVDGAGRISGGRRVVPGVRPRREP